MLPIEHLILGLFPAIYFVESQNILFALVFFLSNILIDLDHYLFVIFKTKFKFTNFKQIYKFYKDLKTNIKIDAIYIFHTIEFLGILYLTYYLTKEVLIIAGILGIIYHILFDFIEVIYWKIRKKDLHFKKTSIIYYLIKKAIINKK